MIASYNNIVFDISENEPKALENREFTLLENCPAFKIGFKAIDMSNIGVIL